MDAWFVAFGLFGCATIVALLFCAYLIPALKEYPEEYRKAGSPSVFWNDWRTWSFLAYVLKGDFKSIPDPSLVTTFKVYRALEATRLFLVLALVLEGLLHNFFVGPAH